MLAKLYKAWKDRNKTAIPVTYQDGCLIILGEKHDCPSHHGYYIIPKTCPPGVTSPTHNTFCSYDEAREQGIQYGFDSRYIEKRNKL